MDTTEIITIELMAEVQKILPTEFVVESTRSRGFEVQDTRFGKIRMLVGVGWKSISVRHFGFISSTKMASGCAQQSFELVEPGSIENLLKFVKECFDGPE